MQKIVNISVATCICILLVQGCSKHDAGNVVNAAGFKVLQPDTCVSIESTSIKFEFEAAWRPYLPSTRFCQLVKPGASNSEIILISIFAEDYYKDKPDGAVWENFPKPILINKKGERVGELVELFPYDLPSEMVLTYGNWQGNIPGEIKMHIIANTVISTYELPTLIWNNVQQRYFVDPGSSDK